MINIIVSHADPYQVSPLPRQPCKHLPRISQTDKQANNAIVSEETNNIWKTEDTRANELNVAVGLI